MGELINFEEYKKEREAKERKKIEEDIMELKLQLEEILDEMQGEAGPTIYYKGYEEVIPLLSMWSALLDGYYDHSMNHYPSVLVPGDDES